MKAFLYALKGEGKNALTLLTVTIYQTCHFVHESQSMF